MGKGQHLERLKQFKERLSRDIPIEKMYLFGSRAAGKPNRWSDFDLLIVSPEFRKKKFRYRALGFWKYWDLDYPVDFLCYTPEEFSKLKKQITIVREAVKEGIEII
ncbi:nucleotidyltransferase domain-containing protein [Candidatus Woesearchaeota archaeon]|nr:nucleotidyltransferase domain-containing protein [Candidatus Woesearchaeota archaeon]